VPLAVSQSLLRKDFFGFVPRHLGAHPGALCLDLRPDIAQLDSDLTIYASLSTQVGVTKMEECPEGILFASTKTRQTHSFLLVSSIAIVQGNSHSFNHFQALRRPGQARFQVMHTVTNMLTKINKQIA